MRRGDKIYAFVEGAEVWAERAHFLFRAGKTAENGAIFAHRRAYRRAEIVYFFKKLVYNKAVSEKKDDTVTFW